jgi:hypothetical protein
MIQYEESAENTEGGSRSENLDRRAARYANQFIGKRGHQLFILLKEMAGENGDPENLPDRWGRGPGKNPAQVPAAFRLEAKNVFVMEKDLPMWAPPASWLPDLTISYFRKIGETRLSLSSSGNGGNKGCKVYLGKDDV